MDKIKTKLGAKDGRALGRAVSLTHRAKDAYAYTREQAEQQHQPEEHSPVQYAGEQVQGTVENATYRIAGEVQHTGRDAIRTLQRRGVRQKAADTNSRGQDREGNSQYQAHTRENPYPKGESGSSVHKAGAQEATASGPSRSVQIRQRMAQSRIKLRTMEQGTARACQTANAAFDHEQNSAYRRLHSLRNTERPSEVQGGNASSSTVQNPLAKQRFVQSRSKSVVSGEKTIKTLNRGAIKSADKAAKSTKAAVKTTRAAAKTAQKTAMAAAKASKQAAQSARVAAKTTAATVKAVVKAAIAAGRAIIAAVKELISLIAAGGWVPVVVILVLCLIGFLVCSPFGLFFSGENKDANMSPLAEVVQEVNAEFDAKIAGIKAAHPEATRVEITYEGSADNIRVDNWIDVAAVFAVKTSMNENGMDVATIDAQRVEIIRSIFWDMNRILSYVETIEHTETVTITKPDGTKEERAEITYEYVLHIDITSKTAEQQVEDYGFTDDQKSVMAEMLSGQFRPMMLTLLGIDASTGLSPEELENLYHDLPVGEVGTEIVRLALSRLGDPYSQQLAGQDDYTDCSYLTRWCYQQIGVYLPRTAAVQAEYCVNNGLTIGPGGLAPGDLVFYSFEENGRFMNISHVAIYAGNGYIVDASSNRGQVVYRPMLGGAVLYGRAYD